MDLPLHIPVPTRYVPQGSNVRGFIGFIVQVLPDVRRTVRSVRSVMVRVTRMPIIYQTFQADGS